MKKALLSLTFALLSTALFAQAPTEDLRVFPNPVVATFEIGHTDRVTDIRVVNMVGREVAKFDYAPREKYDISDLPQGMYLVQLRDTNDKVIHTQRVKKQ